MRTRKRDVIPILRGSGLVVDNRTDLNAAANDSAITADGRRRGNTTTSIANIRNQSSTQLGERPAQKLN